MSGVEKQDHEAANLLVEIVQDAGFDYRINLTKLVDGVSEYTLTYNGEVSVHPDTDEAYTRLRQLQAEVKTGAALEFIQTIRHEARKAALEEAAGIAFSLKPSSHNIGIVQCEMSNAIRSAIEEKP